MLRATRTGSRSEMGLVNSWPRGCNWHYNWAKLRDYRKVKRTATNLDCKKPKVIATAKGLGLNWPTGSGIQRDCNLGYRKPRVIRSVRQRVTVMAINLVTDLVTGKGLDSD